MHHLVCAFQQTAALSGTSLGLYFQLSDGATNQVCIVFRSDGAILLTSGTPAGTVLDTYTGAVSLQNQWFAFEFEVVIHPTAGSWAVRRNGNTSNDHVLGSLNTRPGTNTQANKLTVGLNTTVNNQLLDDLLWRSDASSVPWVGDIRSYVRMPASDVQKQFTSSAAAFPQLPLAQNTTTPPTAGLSKWMPFTAATTGNVALITLPTGSGASTANYKCSIYSSVGGQPAAALGSATTVNSPAANSTIQFNFPSPVAVTQGTQYFVGICVDVASGTSAVNTVSPTFYTLAGSYAAFPMANPTGLSTATANWFAFTVNITANVSSPFVAEAQQDGATTYVYDSNVGDADFYSIAPIAVTPASVVAVTTRGFMQKSDAGSRSGGVQMKSGGTTVQQTGVLSTTWAWQWRTDTVDPATSAAWTPVAVNNIQVGPYVSA